MTVSLQSGGHIPAYDGGDSLFTAGALPFDTRKFEAIVYSEYDKRCVKRKLLRFSGSLKR